MSKSIEELELERQELRGELQAAEGSKAAYPQRYQQLKEALARVDADYAAAQQAAAANGVKSAPGCAPPEPASNPEYAPTRPAQPHPVAGGGDPVVLQGTPAPAPGEEPLAEAPAAPAPATGETFYGTESVPADSHPGSLAQHVVSARIAPSLRAASEEVRAAGGIITSSGGTRGLSASVSAGRSATSFHYSGLAIDLYIYSGMHKPDKDPYVVIKDTDDWQFRVYARAACGEVLTLPALRFTTKEIIDKVQYGIVDEVEVTDSFCDLTAIFANHGLLPIHARGAFADDPKKRQYLSAEWWHFQVTGHLVKDTTTFGAVLKELYTERQLTDTPPWQYRNHVYNGNDGFAAPPKAKKSK